MNSRSLPGELWGITTYFNPAGYKTKSTLYRLFRESCKNQGLNLPDRRTRIRYRLF